MPRLAAACAMLVACRPVPAIAQNASPPAPAPSHSAGSTASGDVLLDSAINRLQHHSSVSARVRLRVRLFGHELFGTGRYLQKGSGGERQVRFELSIPTSATPNVMISVSNGRQWWRYLETLDNQQLTVVDLTAVRAAAADARAEGLSTFSHATAPGGLSQTLQRLQDNFQFASASQTTQADRTFWVTRGRWKTDRLQQLIAPTEKEQVSKLFRQLSGRLPREVVLYLYDDSLFPAKIEYVGSAPATASNTQQPTFSAIEFFQIHFGPVLDESHFQRPRDMISEDVTDRYVKDMGLAKTRSR
ncbi:MAG: hypothetical protein GTO62_08035 [Planctomycetales bacterium]|nr:hypothetical protein [Planctomycetales bacterium]